MLGRKEIPYKEENLKLLKKELEKKNIVIKSNVHYDRLKRTYYVKEVIEDRRITKEGRLEEGFRLVNDTLPKEAQIFLAFPNTPIKKTKENNKSLLILTYQTEIDIERDFNRLARAKNIQDLEIYIYY